MKVTMYHVICLAVSLTYAVAQEMTIPVGVDGNDTLTRIFSQDALGNYDVGYNENQLTGGASFHREKGYANGTREGSYGYTTRNGLIRIVTYVADQDGYRPQLLTNEPGILAMHPSNVTVTKEKEPDPEALARGPTGVPNVPNAAVSSTDTVMNYVMSTGSSSVTGNVGSPAGSAYVVMASPYAQLQYYV